MYWLRSLNRLLITLCACGSVPAYAGLLILPHMGEYGKAVPGMYGLFSLASSRTTGYFNAYGDNESVNNGSVDIQSVIIGAAFLDNWFRDTSVPFLNKRTQQCGIAISAAHIQGRGSVVDTANLLGLSGGANEIGDLYGQCGVQGITHRLGPVKGHLQFTGIVKAPVGSFEQDNLYNWGTHYWMFAPQVSLHAEWGQLMLDSTLVYQRNGDNDEPSSAGLTPTHIPNWRNAAANLGWKITDRWWADVGFSYNASVGPNRFDAVNISPKDQPVPPTALCDPLALPVALCNINTSYYIQSRPGPYYDNGVVSRYVTSTVYYVYRSSLLISVRAGKNVGGRGAEIPALFDVCAAQPCGPDNAIQQTTLTAQGVNEAAASSSGVYYELRMIFPMGSP